VSKKVVCICFQLDVMHYALENYDMAADA